MTISLPFEQKIITKEQAWELKNVGKLSAQWGLTNGVFDLLHRGHVSYLARAKAICGTLIVAVNSDASVRRLGKGDDRPLNLCEDRVAVLAALASVDFVLAFDDDTAEPLVRLLQPPHYIKGGDYDLTQTPEGITARRYGGKTHAIAFEFERSTTALLQKIRSKP